MGAGVAPNGERAGSQVCIVDAGQLARVERKGSAMKHSAVFALNAIRKQLRQVLVGLLVRLEAGHKSPLERQAMQDGVLRAIGGVGFRADFKLGVGLVGIPQEEIAHACRPCELLVLKTSEICPGYERLSLAQVMQLPQWRQRTRSPRALLASANAAKVVVQHGDQVCVLKDRYGNCTEGTR